ncbi:unnamed protein product [Phytophthora lilii]|uniref:Unnamed protein product n=1 Tax=Phytophthora lilii TaxID=2077276 RepID=A0A9W6XD79_9STRA|nr:unnamed protein product [Phytophthora lilii]
MQALLHNTANETDEGPVVVDTVEGIIRHVAESQLDVHCRVIAWLCLGLQGHLKGSKNQKCKVLIRMKLLWTLDHTYGQWKLIRMHLVDAQAPASLEEMLSVSWLFEIHAFGATNN